MTCIIGAHCKDGIVIVADRMLSGGPKPEYVQKIHGDFAHVIVAYTGRVWSFDVFRKYVVGDYIVTRDSTKKYDPERIVGTLSKSVWQFNAIYREFMAEAHKESFIFEILIGKHFSKTHGLKLYHADHFGRLKVLKYKSIGSGGQKADLICSGLVLSRTMMKTFAQRAYLAIRFIQTHYPDLGVGVAKRHPDVYYLYDNEKWDKRAPDTHLDEFRKVTNTILGECGEDVSKIRQRLAE